MLPNQLRVNGPPHVKMERRDGRVYCWVLDPVNGVVFAQGECPVDWLPGAGDHAGVIFATEWAEGLPVIDPNKRPVVDNPQA